MKVAASTPLQLEDTFFTEIEVKANPEFFSGEREKGVSVETSCTMIVPAQQKRVRFSLQLHLRVLDEDETSVSPYHVNVSVFGNFSVDEEHEEHLPNYQTSALSILISSARELILQLTGRGPGQALQLPTLNPNRIIHDAEVVEVDYDAAKSRDNEEPQKRA